MPSEARSRIVSSVAAPVTTWTWVPANSLPMSSRRMPSRTTVDLSKHMDFEAGRAGSQSSNRRCARSCVGLTPNPQT